MKKLLLVVLVVLMLSLAGCDTPDYSEQLDNIEQSLSEPQVIVDTEIEYQIIEVPVVVYDTITEVEVIHIPEIIYEVEESRSMFYTADTDLAIFVISRGSVSYIIEFAYTDTLLDPPTIHLVQIEKQVDGYTEDWFFASDHTETSVFSEEIAGWEEFVYKMDLVVEDTTWGDVVQLYEMMYDDYYGLD